MKLTNDNYLSYEQHVKAQLASSTMDAEAQKVLLEWLNKKIKKRPKK